MSERPFAGVVANQVPIDPVARRLVEFFSKMKPGDSVSASDVEGVVGVPSKSGRYVRVVTKAIRMHLESSGFHIIRKNNKFFCHEGDDQLQFEIDGTRSGIRKTVRHARNATIIPASRLSDRALVMRDRTVAVAVTIRAAAENQFKRLPPIYTTREPNPPTPPTDS